MVIGLYSREELEVAGIAHAGSIAPAIRSQTVAAASWPKLAKMAKNIGPGHGDIFLIQRLGLAPCNDISMGMGDAAACGRQDSSM